MTRKSAGLSVVVPDGERPRPLGWARPDRLGLGVDSLPGVAATLARRLRALGVERIDDLLLRRPRRYESAADEVAIAAETVPLSTTRTAGKSAAAVEALPNVPESFAGRCSE